MVANDSPVRLHPNWTVASDKEFEANNEAIKRQDFLNLNLILKIIFHLFNFLFIQSFI